MHRLKSRMFFILPVGSIRHYHLEFLLLNNRCYPVVDVTIEHALMDSLPSLSNYIPHKMLWSQHLTYSNYASLPVECEHLNHNLQKPSLQNFSTDDRDKPE